MRMTEEKKEYATMLVLLGVLIILMAVIVWIAWARYIIP